MSEQFNLVAPINQLGYGVVATNLFLQLWKMQQEVALWPMGSVTLSSEHHPLLNRALYNAKFWNPDAPSLRVYHPFDMALFPGRGKRCGYTFFETTLLRDQEVHHLRNLDTVITASRWGAGVLEANGIPRSSIAVVPPAVDTSIFHPDVAPARKQTKNTTVFLNVGKWEYRKGHDFVLKAFEAAFTPADDVHLVMCCYNPLVMPGFDGPHISKQWEDNYLFSNMGMAGKITVLDHRLETQEELARLMAGADVGFFPSRAEGWGLPATEMAAMGKPVILTDYSAHRQFAEQIDAYRICSTKMEQAFDGFFFLGNTGEWMALEDYQLEQAVYHLRTLHRYKREHGRVKLSTKGVEAFGSNGFYNWEHATKTILGLCYAS